MFETLVLNRAGATRRAVLNGRWHTVVPCTAMGEGVWAGSQGPKYYPAKEFQNTVLSWNHKPVVVNHPADGFPRLHQCGGEPTRQ